ncbi:MAG: restriction endonuclease subunit S, partial [Bacteroidaceae bacterium]|nr:restriction endonuclease subunit S [Bacteroidaceae bacterium]
VDEGGILFVTSENVREGYLELAPPKYVDSTFNTKQKRSILHKNDVLVNIVGASIGRSAIFDLDIVDANINQAVALIRLDFEKVKPEYLCRFLNSNLAMEKYDLMKKDTARANLSLENIGDIEFPLPPLPEQQTIVTTLDALSEKCRRLEEIAKRTIALCDDMKQALLRKAFNGEL